MIVNRTWQQALDEIFKTKQGSTQYRWQTAAKDPAFAGSRFNGFVHTSALPVNRYSV